MKLFEKQLWHLLSLGLLLFAVVAIVQADEKMLIGSFWNVSTKTWLLWAVLIPIIHQVYVLIIWRIELYYQWLSKNIGKYAFRLYLIDFVILFIARIVFIIFLAESNKNTFKLNTSIKNALIIVISFIALYAFYSVVRFFGIDRAAGLDHFEHEEKRPLVKKGIFKYTRNGMYTFAFLAIYLPALFYLSKAALLVAIFSHVYIWIHYFFTELPDMKRIYGPQIKTN